jgi:saccharopine dehydrogenase-like NADP-dependent oxidoreductase
LAQKIQSVLVIGLGKVGKLVATLLFENGYRTTGLDSGAHRGHAFKTIKGRVQSKAVLKKAIKDHDAVVTCLPYDLNLEVARETHSAGKHYFDLTEDVPTTDAIKKLSKTAKGVMAPQCGLAPGFICIVGADLASKFRKLRSIELRVGALPQHPRGLLGYAFNWSPEGVVNEYLNDCEVIKESKRAKVTSMEGLETIVIDGLPLEAFATSGGLGTMCETYEGKVEHLNYKTIRYPGHCQLMKFFFNELFMRKDRQMAGEILVNAKPPVNDDVVFVHAAVEGEQNGKLMREEFVRSYYPLNIDGEEWRAIAWTTAGSVCAVVDLVSRGVLPQKGFIRQEDIPLDQFFKTPTGQYYLS